MNKLLITIGVAFIIVGILWKYILQIPFFKLPGDIVIDKPNFKFYFPITTMIIFSLVLTFIFWIIKKLF